MPAETFVQICKCIARPNFCETPACVKPPPRSTWRKENELKDMKTELAALDRKIQLSLTPIDKSDDKQKVQTPEFEAQKNYQRNGSERDEMSENKIDISRKTYDADTEKKRSNEEILQGLLSGKISPKDFKSRLNGHFLG